MKASRADEAGLIEDRDEALFSLEVSICELDAFKLGGNLKRELRRICDELWPVKIGSNRWQQKFRQQGEFVG
jgi:hypothetical protein